MRLRPRIPLRKRKFANYSKSEELINMISHIVCAVVAVALLVLCVVKAAKHENVWGIVTAALFGSFVIIMGTISSIYHGLPKNTGKQVMRIIDNCDMYFVVAGTCTPILLVAVRPSHPIAAWVIFGIIWAAVAAATSLTAIDLKRYRLISFICFLVASWGVLLCANVAIKVLTMAGFIWIISGAVAFTVGALFYLIGTRERYAHGFFHLCVFIGVILQFVGIYFYVM